MRNSAGCRHALQAKQIAIAVAAAFAPYWAHGQTPPAPSTLPTGGVVTHGSGTIHAPVTTSGLATMQIDQGTSRMAARFDAFSIGSSAQVNVSQPSSSSIALFKDVGGSVSQIYGGLTANGQIFISNPNGVLIGRTGRVEAAGFVASTLSLNENEFMLGGNSFNWVNNGATGTVTNEGTIFTLGGYTMLAGLQVRNDGLIRANAGSVVLAAGDRVNLDLVGDGLISVSVDQAALNASAINTGTIEAEGGKVLLTARSANALLDTVVNAGGAIRATSLVNVNGEIVLDGGSAGTVTVAGRHDARSASVSGAAITMNGTISTGFGSGTQTVTTPGTLTIRAGSGFGENAGLVHLGSGEQRVTAGNVSLMGGNGGSSNHALITSNNAAADQTITVAGGMQVNGGSGTDNNQATVRSAGNQRVQVGGTLGVEGGAFGSNNTAFIIGADANAAGKKQVIDAGSIILRSGAGGFQNAAVIVAPRQEITTSGDVIIAAGGTGGQLGGTRIGGTSTGAGGINTMTDLKLTVGNDLLMTGGLASGNAAIIGSTGNFAQTAQIQVGRDVALSGQGGSIARIGTGQQGALGDISVTAGRDVRVNGSGEIVTAGKLTLKAGTLNVEAGSLSSSTARITSGAGQDIEAQSIRVTSQNARTAQIVNGPAGEQLIKAATIDIQTLGLATSLAEIRNNSVADQKITVTGDRLAVRGLGGGTAAIFGNGNQTIDMTRSGPKSIILGDHAAQGLSTITTNGDQKITGYADITLTGGSSAIANGGNAAILANNPTRTQRIEANNLSLANSILGGNNSFAGIQGANQTIHALGNVTLTANASGGTLPGVRIGGLSGPGATSTNLLLTAGGDVVLTAGSANNGVGIGTTAAPPAGVTLVNNITIDADGSVILNAGTAEGAGVRIGASVNGNTPGDIRINAGGTIALNGAGQSAAIRSQGNVTLEAGSISEAGNGFVQAGALTTKSTAGNTTLTGPNQVSSYNGTSSGDLSLSNTGPLTVTGVDAAGNASLTNALGDVNLVGRWRSANASIASGGSLIESGGGFIQTGSLTTFVGLATNLGGANEIGVFSNTRPSDVTLNNTTGLHLLDVGGPNHVTVTAAGNITIGGRVGGSRVELTANGGGIEQTASGSIVTGILGHLQTSSTGDTVLNSAANQTASFSATSGGDVSLVTNGFLTVTGMNAAGDAAVTDFGNISVGGSPWTAGGRSSIAAGDIILNTVLSSPEVHLDAGSGRIVETFAGGIFTNTLTTRSGSSTQLTSFNQIANYNGTSGADLTLNNSGALNVTGLSAGGPAAVTNFGHVTISGPWSSTAASITANGFGSTIGEAGGGAIQAGNLTTFSEGATILDGANQVANFSGSTSFGGTGGISLNNSGTLNVAMMVTGGSATLTNAGDVNVAGSWSSGPTSVTTTGGDLSVSTLVFSSGAMTLDVGGILTVSANGPQGATLQSNGGQAIRAQAVEVLAQNGGFASINNSSSGEQRITISGGGTSAGLDVHTRTSGGAAQIGQLAAGFAQIIEVADADHINVNGAGPGPFPGSGAGIAVVGGAQNISITGSGANAISIGSLGARGGSSIGGGRNQSVTAGLAGQQGSITVVGADVAQTFVGISTNTIAGGTQTVSTSGAIDITGGRVLSGAFSPGLFHNGTGQQTINAGAITLKGGPSGNGNAALINASGGGNPLNGGAQVINVSGDITLTGGPGGNAGILGSATRQQTIHAHNISVTNSAGGGNNSVGFIQGGHQEIHATGDVTLTARASGGGVGGPGVRIGGLAANSQTGFAGTSTDLDLFVGGDLVLNGGSAVNNGVAIGSTAAGPGLPNEIYIKAGGRVILNSGTLEGTAARIGSALTTGTASGNIEIHAGGAIEMNGVAQPTAIRTLGNVTLEAASISQGSNGFIVADTLTTTTSSATSLTGPNQVSRFSGTSGNELTLNNSGTLEVTGLGAAGDATLTNVGNVTVSGAWTAGGNSHISAHSDLVLAALLTSANVTMQADGSLTQFGTNGVGAVVADTLTTKSGGSTFFSGENRVTNYSGTSGADLTFFNRGDLNVTGMSANSANLSNQGAVTISGPWVTAAHTNITAVGGPGASLSESAGGYIQASGFSSLSADGSVNLNGPNRISGTLFGSSMQGDFALANAGDLNLGVSAFIGDVHLANAGILNVTSLSARNAAVRNAGPMTVGGFWNSNGTTSITTTGAASDLTVGTMVSSQGAMSISVDGTLTVAASGLQVMPPPGFPPAPQVASLLSFGGQQITARSVLVSAQDGASASINNQVTGSQSITIVGGSLDILSSGVAPSGPGSSASIFNSGPGTQSVSVTGGERIRINGVSGFASLGSMTSQEIFITGNGANAITIGSAGALGGANVFGRTQVITAGAAGEQGSISIVGSDVGGRPASVTTQNVAGGTQTVSTSGLLSVTGGTALNQTFAAGIFHGGTGDQTVNAARIELNGGAAGNNNAALIVANNGAQNVNVAGDLIIAGGAGGNAGISGPAARLQNIRAANIHLSNSAAGGFNSVGFILGGHQDIRATGDVTLTARASGGDLPGVRIGGLSGASATSTDLVLNVGGDLVLTGGTLAGNGVGIGSTAAPGPSFANNITINTGGDLILNSGVAGSAARIGSSATTGPAGGDIQITAGGDIRLNGVNENAAIRTLGNMSLEAASITEGPKGLIEAGTLTTRTGGDTLLTGPNRVASFTASSDHGNVHLTNTSAVLTLGAMDLPGVLSIVQTGDVAVGNASATEATVIAAAGDVSVSATGHIFVRGSDTTAGAGAGVLADGRLAFSAGDVTLRAGDAAMTPVVVRGANGVEMTVGNELNVTGGGGFLSPALLSSGGDIDLTLGQAVRVDGGSGFLSIARVQTETTDGVIRLTFPNLTEGGYFVNGIEGRRHNDDSGFYSVLKPAKVGKTLLLEYGN